ncbi:MAG: hypothetical protein HOE53_03660 [Candidatus Magasanikbacteria bacterium]|jgi:uncharacterized RDD family membrane protein YckC|nr:hypothetical protein [Candidatus Magasanikbacteria bacterium]
MSKRNWPFAIRRLFAFLIDFVVMFVPMVFIAIPLISWNESLWKYLLVPAMLFMPLYIVLRDGVHGAGIGKRICKLIVVDAQGNPISYKKSMERQWTYFSGIVIFEPIWFFFFKKNHSMADLSTNTRTVLKTNSDTASSSK